MILKNGAADEHMELKRIHVHNLIIFVAFIVYGVSIAFLIHYLGLSSISVAIASFLTIGSAVLLIICQKKLITAGKKKYRRLFNLLPIPVLLIKRGKVQYVNEKGLELFETEEEKALIGRSIFDFFQTSNGLNLPLKENTPEHHQSGSIIGKLKTINGTNKNVKIDFCNSSFFMEKGYSLVIRDITEFKENEKRLHHSEQLSVIGELAAGIAHEIRNPLTSLMGFLQLIGTDQNTDKKYKRIMVSELERINLIVNELLLLAKPKEYEFEPKNLVSLLKTVVTIANTQAILYNIEIVTKFPPDMKDVMVNCEENKLKQVFLNLLRNGIEAMKAEGQIIIEMAKRGEMVVISFIDHGEGIPEEVLHNLGKRFYTTKDDGTGLGLMISMNIIREHQGDIAIQSKKDEGTRIDVSLPL